MQWLIPGRVARIAQKMHPWVAFLVLALFGVGLFYALFDSPPDYQQGESVRIMYVHVPAAWMALFVYVFMAGCSAGFLIYKNPVCDVLAQASAPIGAVFTFITLATGMIWGKPIWGAWWVWDARLTSALILFFFYIGYIMLASAFENAERGAKSAAVLAIVGCINVPIVKFSVDWWNTLHQPASVFKLSGPSIHPDMLVPLLIMSAAYMALFGLVLLMNLQSTLWQRKLQHPRRL